ncbi:hypothetical protein [Lysinibacillus fusiformis]|uniref:hypothetical protein n=1 Tax=Lysinibacillus fusiformis TaxID=28031 RepID=UPI003810502B
MKDKDDKKYFDDEREVLADTPHEGGDGHGGSDNHGGSGGGCTPDRPRPDPPDPDPDPPRRTGVSGVRGFQKKR